MVLGGGNLRWIGLTGGIASGKSTVSRILTDQGLAVIDADRLAREAVALGTDGHREVVTLFGPDAVTPDGNLNRALIGSIVFADRSRLAALEAIIHPRVRARSLELRAEFERAGAAVAFYDVPLLFEKGMREMFDRVVLVTCSPEIQLARVMARDGLTKDAALARIAAQMPLASKVPLADVVIVNDGSLEELRAQVMEMLGRV